VSKRSSQLQLKRAMKQTIAKSTEKYSDRLVKVAPQDYPVPTKENLIEVWISKKYLVQIYAEESGIIRLSINKNSIQGTGFRKDGSVSWGEISWDELQELKNEVGYQDYCAVEIYPPAAQVVNVANMRHLWVLPIAPSYMWGAECQ
jgi:hypothetical protein